MIRKIVLSLTVFIILLTNADAQVKLKDSNGILKNSEAPITGLTGKSNTASESTFIVAGIVLFLVNPEIVIEDKKVYFGLTKEISAGIYPYGRVAFEYTHVFRGFDRNHLRISYNLDYITESKDFIAFWVSGGIGYFSDTKHNGIFPQLSFAALIPIRMSIFGAVYPYIKARHTFVNGQENSNITDFSLGMGLLLYY